MDAWLLSFAASPWVYLGMFLFAVIDGFFLDRRMTDAEVHLNLAGCYAQVEAQDSGDESGPDCRHRRAIALAPLRRCVLGGALGTSRRAAGRNGPLVAPRGKLPPHILRRARSTHAWGRFSL